MTPSLSTKARKREETHELALEQVLVVRSKRGAWLYIFNNGKFYKVVPTPVRKRKAK